MTITRFAPSPTGYLHIGGLRTALYNYLWAKKNQGKFLLRIEDTDSNRNSDNAKEAIIKSFDWLGLEYDDKEIYQSQREDIYKKYIKQLLDEDKAYYCYMSKDELDDLRATQISNKQTPRYDGRYRDFKGTVPKGIEPVIRLKSPLSGKIEFEDVLKGKISFDSNVIDDFIIARSNGMPTYNFVVAIDDALMNISEVIRGDDHLINTPKQILIYKALGFSIPKFVHIPMINNPQGKKLSKRDGATDVMEYKDQGYLPQALLNFLVRLGWSNKDQEIFSMRDMVELFDPNDINKSSSSYNQQKLLWLNAHYIKSSSNKELIKNLLYFECNCKEFKNIDLLLNISKNRAKTLIELKAEINSIINSPSSYDEKGVKKFIKDNTFDILLEYIKLLEKNQDFLNSIKDFEDISNPFIKDYNLKYPEFFQPLRLALTGSIKAPSVYDMMIILGFKESIKRVQVAIKNRFL